MFLAIIFPVDLGMAFVNNPANLTAKEQHMTSEVLFYLFKNISTNKMI